MKRSALCLTLLLSSALAAAPKDTLVVMDGADIATLDPSNTYDSSSGTRVENLYETLVTYPGNDLKRVVPLLATAWKATNGGRTYTFTLRQGVKFHSGNTFGCKDAEYTLRRNLVTNTGNSGNWFMGEALLGTPANANDDKNVTWDKIARAAVCSAQGQLVLTLPKVDPALLAKLAFVGQSIIDRDHAIKLGEWDGTEKSWKSWVGKDINDSVLSRNPSGTGAYQLVKRDATVQLFRAFPGYWGKKPALPNIVLQKVPEQATRFEALKRGDADLIETGPRSSLSQLQGQAGVRVLDDLPNVSSGAFFLNQEIKDPKLLGSGKLDGQGVPVTFFQDVNVRRAFNYAFDYTRFIEEVMLGKGTQRTMLLPDSFPGYDPTVRKYRFDQAQATVYFKRAYGGQLWKNGFVLRMNYRAGAAAAQTAAELLKRNIEAINPKFRVEIGSKQWSQILEDSRQGKEAMVILAWAPDYADPDNFLYTYFASDGFYHPRVNFKDATIDTWLNQARTTTDLAKRNRLYSLVGNRAYEQAYYLNIPAGVTFLAMRSDLKGITKATFNPMINFAGGVLWKDLSK